MEELYSRLVKGCQSANPHAQKEVFAILGGKIKAICFRYCSDFHIAEDLMQESFVTVFSKIDQFNNLGSFEGWVKRIAVNTSLQWLRKQKDFILMDNLQYTKERDWTDHEHEDELLDVISGEKLIQIIAQLPKGYRVVLNLHAIEGYSHREIGEKLGVTEVTSRTQYHRSKNLLKLKILQELKLVHS